MSESKILAKNFIQRIIDEGFRFIMPGPVRSYEGLERGLELTGRA